MKYSNNKILFLLNPVLAAVNALKDIRDGKSHRILYCWFLLFGIAFCAINEKADSFRYVEDFVHESNYTWNQYVSAVSEWASFESNIKDIYTLSVNYFVGRFTDNYHWVFFIYATIFGFFYISSLKIFLKTGIKDNLIFYSLLFIFCYSNPIFNINGARFWTAAWIGVYVALNIFVKKDYSKIPLLLLLPLIHGSSVIWIVIILFALLVSLSQNVAIILYIASSFVSAVSYLNVLDDYSYMLPQFMQALIWSYTQSEEAQQRLSGISEYGAVYADFLMALPGYFQILLSYILILNRKYINIDNAKKRFFTVFLAMSALTNFLSAIPSVGRFTYMVIPFFVIVLAQNQDIVKKYKYLFYALPIIYVYSLLYWFRHMISISEIYLYIFPSPITAIYYLFLV